MKLQTISGLARAIDFKYPTNRAIAAICLTVFIAMLCWSADAALSLRTAVYIFFAWALARELDPDRDLAAFLAVIVALALLFLTPFGSGPMFWTLLIVRVLNRTTGIAANPLDLGLVLVLAYGNPYLLSLSAVALALDAWISPRTLSWVSALIFVSLAIVAAGNPIALNWTPLLAIPCMLAIPSSRTTRTDATDQLLDPKRVRAGQAMAALTLAAGAPQQMIPILAAFLATALYALPSRFFQKSA